MTHTEIDNSTILKDIDLKTLEGDHYLSGVDFTSDTNNEGEDGTQIHFILDGETYTAKEDPSDGYRSSLGVFGTSDYRVKNTFPEVLLKGKYLDETDEGRNDSIKFFDRNNKKLVLEIGTNHSDDYYPSFVCYFAPENIAKESRTIASTKKHMKDIKKLFNL